MLEETDSEHGTLVVVLGGAAVLVELTLREPMFDVPRFDVVGTPRLLETAGAGAGFRALVVI